jgi:hypothetical protein
MQTRSKANHAALLDDDSAQNSIERERRTVETTRLSSRLPALLAILVLALLPLGSGVLAQPQDTGVLTHVSGILDVVVIDDFHHGRAEMAYFVQERASGRFFELQFERMPPVQLKTGDRVTIRGRALGRKLMVESLDAHLHIDTAAGAILSEPATADAVNERHAVVIMVDLTNATASSRYTDTQIADAMWTGARSVDGLYQETSIDQVSWPADTDGNGSPEVFGPFPIDYDNSTCDYYGWAFAAEQAATAAGVDLSLYKHRVFVLPRYNELPACSWVGVANLGCGTYCRSWIAEAESPMVFAHELGHNLGMMHAGTDPENDGTANSSYGDYSDPMGSSRSWHGFNASHLDQMGWLASYLGSISTVVAGGTYEIAAIGTDPVAAEAPQALKVEKPDSGELYYLSFRQPYGYDGSLSETYIRGVNIHRFGGSGTTYFIQSLTDGESFVDDVNGITVTQLGVSGDYVTLDIAFGDTPPPPACTLGTPSLSLSPSSQLVQGGSSASYTIRLTNGDSADCSATSFSLSYSGTPAGNVLPSTLTLAPGASNTATLLVSASAADGTYSLSVTAADSDGTEPVHSSVASASATVTIDGTPPSAPGNLSGSPQYGDSVQLSWNASSDSIAGVNAYRVYRNSAYIGQSATTGYTDNSVATGSTYEYRVMAVDEVGNISAPSNAVEVSVPAPTIGDDGSFHVDDLEGDSINNGKYWTAVVVITLADANGTPVQGATVTGLWSDGVSGSASCTTDGAGQCSVSIGAILKKQGSVRFTVSDASHGSLVYDGSVNRDADGDSDGTAIIVSKT